MNELTPPGEFEVLLGAEVTSANCCGDDPADASTAVLTRIDSVPQGILAYFDTEQVALLSHNAIFQLAVATNAFNFAQQLEGV